MPWVSDAQRRWGHSPSGLAALGKKGVAEWDAASKGRKLPARKADGGEVPWNEDNISAMLARNAAAQRLRDAQIRRFPPLPRAYGGQTMPLGINQPIGGNSPGMGIASNGGGGAPGGWGGWGAANPFSRFFPQGMQSPGGWFGQGAGAQSNLGGAGPILSMLANFVPQLRGIPGVGGMGGWGHRGALSGLGGGVDTRGLPINAGVGPGGGMGIASDGGFGGGSPAPMPGTPVGMPSAVPGYASALSGMGGASPAGMGASSGMGGMGYASPTGGMGTGTGYASPNMGGRLGINQPAMAAGGIPTAPWYERGAMYRLNRVGSGFMKGTTPGRTDKLNLDVRPGSYVLPADTVSHLGQNNSLAGAKALNGMFGKANLGMRGRLRMGRQFMGQMASGGTARGKVPIKAADGEYIVSPEQVAHIGGGDMKKGYQILDRFVHMVRQDHIKSLRKLPPPKV